MTFVQFHNDETGITSPKRPPVLQNCCWTRPASHLVARFDLSTKAFGFSFDISKTCWAAIAAWSFDLLVAPDAAADLITITIKSFISGATSTRSANRFHKSKNRSGRILLWPLAICQKSKVVVSEPQKVRISHQKSYKSPSTSDHLYTNADIKMFTWEIS